MIILKCPEYSCLRIGSFGDIKVDIDWIYTRSKLIIQPETNEHAQKTEKQNTPHKTPYICRVDDAKVDID
jgi:hypothetical protein